MYDINKNINKIWIYILKNKIKILHIYIDINLLKQKNIYEIKIIYFDKTK